MAYTVDEADHIEIQTLLDNYIDLTSGDSTDMLKRASPVRNLEIGNSILAEHGFSALINLAQNGVSHSLLFDFGYSEHGATFNADALELDLTDVELLVLSHGHMDHTGGLSELSKRIGKKEIDLVAHPGVFKTPRFIKTNHGVRIFFPEFTRDSLEPLGVNPVESAGPLSILEGMALFLGEIPRRTDFETGMSSAYYGVAGKEKPDAIEDDTAIVFNLRNRGLIILTGCAHAGIINTVNYAREITGIDSVHAIMGGFHLTGPNADHLIDQTIASLIEIGPEYIIPAHCTGRTAIRRIEDTMPENFLFNMSGTKIIFEP